MRSKQLVFTWCPRAGFGFLDQGPSHWAMSGQRTANVSTNTRKNVSKKLADPTRRTKNESLREKTAQTELWALQEKEQEVCQRQRGDGGWEWGPLKMTQGSQADHWPNIVHPSSPNAELTHCYLLCIGVFLKVLFEEPGKIMKKEDRKSTSSFQRCRPTLYMYTPHMVFSARHPTMPLITLLRTSKMGKSSIVRLDPQQAIHCDQTINELISTYREVSGALPLNWEALPPVIWRKHQRHVYPMSRW